jgi:transposase
MIGPMLMPRKALPAEGVRLLAVRLVLEGEAADEVALRLNVSERSVWRWLGRWRRRGRLGDGALAVRPGRGRPPKLDPSQAARVLRWLDGRATDFGFVTDRWTAPRVASLIESRLGVRMNHRYLNDWLRRRGITPQVPPRQARERDEGVIGAWLSHTWPGIKKKYADAARP